SCGLRLLPVGGGEPFDDLGIRNAVVLCQHTNQFSVVRSLDARQPCLLGLLALFRFARLPRLFLLALELRSLSRKASLLGGDTLALRLRCGLLLGANAGVLRFLCLALLAKLRRL